MKVLIAIDSFKGSLSSLEAGLAAERGVRAAYPDCECEVLAIADGGEGTTEAIIRGTGGRMRSVYVSDPLGRTISAQYGIIDSTSCAVIEMSSAAGITLVEPDERNPLFTSTYGVGEMMLDALELGVRRFLVGIGGSATNDAGVGMLMALGVGLYDYGGEAIPRGAIGLSHLSRIDITTLDKRLSECEIIVASDVKNVLCGSSGASFVYGAQKGADREMMRELDSYLLHFADLTRTVIPTADPDSEGSGAAGGLGFALRYYLGAKMCSGIELVAKTIGLRERIEKSDIVITGEGRLDGQSSNGKAPAGIAKIAKEFGKPCLAFAGSIGDGAEKLHECGIDAYFPILRKVVSLDLAMKKENAEKNMYSAVREVFLAIQKFGVK